MIVYLFWTCGFSTQKIYNACLLTFFLITMNEVMKVEMVGIPYVIYDLEHNVTFTNTISE